MNTTNTTVGWTDDNFSESDVRANTAGYTPPIDETDEARKLRLREEQLDVTKNRVQSGEVEIHKDIIEEQKTIDVPVTHEEVVIERRAVNAVPTDEPIGADETIRVPVSEEQVEVNKRSVVTGEVEVHKREVQETQQVSDTVRREEARIEKDGNLSVKEGSLDADATPPSRKL
ncbi:YsnF/AvaK domain-containing protein [Saccharibacillus sp. CPCC 101409]|nr:YsnF/AvaK domain-containing protein [Saccharibacillus sp. CPCC 101409]MDO3410447.1 YsnF/AvaK domain-containing protein [Saccharibacillus sp. CPCC 101409]